MKALEALLAAGHFDVSKNALESATRLFDRVYADEGRRARVEEKIRSSWSALPVILRIELLLEMAGSAADHGDPAKALALVNDAQAVKDGVQWPPLYGVPTMARLAEARFRAGDKEKASADADAALALFEASLDQIQNFERPETLCPLAKAYLTMGRLPDARKIYKRAVEEGSANENARPRAMDLSATCCSMALNAVEPDAQLWARLREIRAGLGDPW
jgi:tetratricopeptide (TPR) repeat protein